MECGPRTARLARTVVYVAFALAFSTHANAQDGFQLLHSFTFGVDGALPSAPLLVNAAGSVIYGTAQDGGSTNHGNVFRLLRTSQGWKGTVLHSFGQGSDGWYPDAAVIFDKKGNMYGTTSEGGPYGFGTVFEMSPTAGGRWTESLLHAFSIYTENTPEAPLIFDQQGNLYGTTLNGGIAFGTVFQMMPPSSQGGQWTENVIYNFTYTDDGAYPDSALLIDKQGNLYGTSHFAGIQDSGTVYELKRTGTGWQEITLYEFQGGDDGAHPSGPLTTDGRGNLYGTTDDAGAGRCGVVFKLAYFQGAWADSTLYSFNCGPDGANPWGGVNFDRFGNLYGTTSQGGAYGYGAVFKLSPNPDGTWSETVLYTFTNGADGTYPRQGVVPDRLGRLYGVATGGAPPCSCGTVFELSLPIEPTNAP
jgi:uncharacterized repeat protein (TIGR03803 family)